jgi:hypothetical protein
MRIDEDRLTYIERNADYPAAPPGYVADMLWLAGLVREAQRRLQGWEHICERDHGKEPGDFRKMVEEIDGRVKEVEDRIRDLKELLGECLKWLPMSSCAGLIDDILEELGMERHPAFPQTYRKRTTTHGGDLG